MRERPILFSAPMVRAILEGRKTVTRRIVRDAKPLAADVTDFGGWVANDAAVLEEGVRALRRPYGEAGDRLWVRETWGYRGTAWASDKPNQYVHTIHYAADGAKRSFVRPHRDDDGLPKQVCRCSDDGDELDRRMRHDAELTRYWRSWRPSIHMPRWASRLELEVLSVRVERLHAIDEQDAIAEGITAVTFTPDDGFPPSLGYMFGPDDGKTTLRTSARDAFALGWDAINGDRATWASNPWVWRVEFRRVEPVRAPNERRPPAPATMGGSP